MPEIMRGITEMLLLTVLAALPCAGCGAFADAASDDDGDPDLSFSPRFIEQGRIAEVTITFIKPPAWENDRGGYAYVLDLDLGDNGLMTQSYTYDGVSIVDSVIVASGTAQTGERKVELTVGYEKSGQKQQKHSGWGFFYVFPKTGGDGGSGNTGRDGGAE